MAGRPHSPLPNATLRRTHHTTRFPITLCPLNNLAGLHGSGRVGTCFCLHITQSLTAKRNHSRNDFVSIVKDTMFTRRHAALYSTITESKPMAMANMNGSSASVIVFAKHRLFGRKPFCRYREESQMQTTRQTLDSTVWASAAA
jgi:hypothetical protein